MIDCPNGAMRDRLPDLANDTLEPAVRELVLVHLAECAACTSEIEILRTTRLMLRAATPRVNVAGIVSALPQYAAIRAGQVPLAAARTTSRSTWANSWRIAAAMTFLAAGIGSYKLLGNDGAARIQDSIAAAVTVEQTAGLALTGALANMNDDELHALVSDIEKLDALPSTEVETRSTIGVPLILPDSIFPELEVR